MIIVFSGSVGSGKSFISKSLSNKLNFKYVPLNEIARDFKLKEVKELKTFDFDLDKLLDFVENMIVEARNKNENLILESHFAHYINPVLVDYLFIINRNLKELKEEYIKRGYNKRKISDNLEVESFNLCFYEAIENGYIKEKDGSFEIGRLDVINNSNNKNISDLLNIIISKIN